jgi:hypothetical protein
MQRDYGAIIYHHGAELRQEHCRVLSTSLEDAAHRATGVNGLTLVSQVKMLGRNYVVAKVWNGDQWAYAYRLPTL